MLGFERINLVTAGEVAIINLKAQTFQQVFRLQSVRTHVIGHYHPIEGGSFVGGIFGHRHSFLTKVRASIRLVP